MNMPVEATETPDIKTYDLTQAKEMLFDTAKFDQLERFAKIMASGSASVPNHLAGNIGDCMAVTMQAMQWGMNPFAVAGKTHLVNGSLGYEAQLVNAVITSLAPTTGRLQFEWIGGGWDKFMENTAIKANELGCQIRVWATLKGEDKPRELVVSMFQATVRNSPLWASDPKQQLAYLAIKKWSRLYCPDVIMGVYSQDEFEPEGSLANTSSYVADAAVIEVEHVELPPYPAEKYNDTFGKYTKMIAEKKKTAKELIDQLSLKYTLTEDQKITYIDFENDLQGVVNENA